MHCTHVRGCLMEPLVRKEKSSFLYTYVYIYLFELRVKQSCGKRVYAALITHAHFCVVFLRIVCVTTTALVFFQRVVECFALFFSFDRRGRGSSPAGTPAGDVDVCSPAPLRPR
jgi:hypothetical protein